jgi:uncharacterized membrane protein YgcG
MPDRPCSSIAALALPTTSHLLPSLTFCLVFVVSTVSVSAEVRVISSQGEFRMGDRDTREAAMRLATEAAKRNALEQVATYLESVTVVEGDDITKDEITTYTAGLILVLDQQANVWIDGDSVVVTVDLTSQIDTEEVAQAILALRENESARHQLTTLKTEIDELHRELEAANLSLAAAITDEEAQQASVQRQDILNRVQSNAMVSQIWTDWVIVAPVGYLASWGGMQPQSLLNAARSLYPASPHVEAAQQVVVMKPATAQPHALPPITVQPPGARPVPPTLNEISHTTPKMPVRLGSQSSDVRAIAPVPIAPRSVAPGQQTPSFGSRSVRSLQQFLQPRAGMTPPSQTPITRRLPPTMRQNVPSYLAPRGSYHLAPRGSGGHYRGGGRGGAGGRGGGGHGGGRGR